MVMLVCTKNHTLKLRSELQKITKIPKITYIFLPKISIQMLRFLTFFIFAGFERFFANMARFHFFTKFEHFDLMECKIQRKLTKIRECTTLMDVLSE